MEMVLTELFRFDVDGCSMPPPLPTFRLTKSSILQTPRPTCYPDLCLGNKFPDKLLVNMRV